MRVNLMVYRDIADPWLWEFRQTPEQTLLAMMPGLENMMGGFKVSGSIKIRPADLCVTEGHIQPGIVLVGDAFSTSCPAAGTGTTKVFTDVERLCNVYIPQWLATDGMDAEKIAGVLQRSGQGGVRSAMPRQGISPSFAVDRQQPAMARAALGPFGAAISQGILRSIRERPSAGSVPRAMTAKKPAHS